MTLEFEQIEMRHGGRICFADKILALSRTSNPGQNCVFEQFESEPKFMITGQDSVLVHFQIVRMCNFVPYSK